VNEIVQKEIYNHVVINKSALIFSQRNTKLCVCFLFSVYSAAATATRAAAVSVSVAVAVASIPVTVPISVFVSISVAVSVSVSISVAVSIAVVPPRTIAAVRFVRRCPRGALASASTATTRIRYGPTDGRTKPGSESGRSGGSRSGKRRDRCLGRRGCADESGLWSRVEEAQPA
jgi:hypothetical protein